MTKIEKNKINKHECRGCSSIMGRAVSERKQLMGLKETGLGCGP